MTTPYPNYPKHKITVLWIIGACQLWHYSSQYGEEWWLVNYNFPMAHSQRLVFLGELF